MSRKEFRLIESDVSWHFNSKNEDELFDIPSVLKMYELNVCGDRLRVEIESHYRGEGMWKSSIWHARYQGLDCTYFLDKDYNMTGYGFGVVRKGIAKIIKGIRNSPRMIAERQSVELSKLIEVKQEEKQQRRL